MTVTIEQRSSLIMPPALTADDLRGIALTTVIVGGFAAGWGISGSLALPGSMGSIVLIVVLAITAVLFFLAYQFVQAARDRPSTGSQGPNPFRTRDYQLAVLAEIIAILLAGRLLTTAGHPDAIMPAVAAIVGLHFFGLIRAFHSWHFAIVGAVIVLLALLSFALPPTVTVGSAGTQFRSRAAFVGLGCALCLWSGIASIVVGTWRRLDSTV
jgi:hypothetical protein